MYNGQLLQLLCTLPSGSIVPFVLVFKSIYIDVEGMDSRYFDRRDPPADVTSVDLDTNSVTVYVQLFHHVLMLCMAFGSE